MAHGARRLVPLLIALPFLLLAMRGPAASEIAPAPGTPAVSRASVGLPEPPSPEFTTAQAARAATVDRTINPDGFTSARVCGECHTEIYASWRNSLHAFSLTDPVFDAAFMQAVRVEGDGVREVCLNCHAPIARETGDYALKDAVTAEGVTCDYCHSVTAVHMDRPQRPYVLDPGPVKRSVLRNAASPVHEVAYSQLHETAEFCGGCHNFTTASGVSLMSTYDEWKAGPYAAEGRPCQGCHMTLAPGGPVDPAISTDHEEHHLHSLIHDREQLQSAVAVEIADIQRRGDSLDVEVAIQNIGSGHMLPTGMPTREIVLTVLVAGGPRERSEERRYGRVIADANGKVLKSDHEVLLYGSQIVNDNRLAPRERRVERLQFYAPGNAPLKVSATVSYYYAPMVLDVRTMNIQMARVERDVR